MTGRPIRFEWYDYSAHPIGEGISLPDDLDKRVRAWGGEGDQRLYRDAESLAWNEWIVDWMKRGRALAIEVSEVLDCPVDYLYEMTEEVERIEPPKKPVVRRHHRPRRN